ncbi:MAG TPA: sigma-70 family RNA polymerase sigma factor [Vicinamibacteria bacterium]|jgi:RNA polymerase sigma factor (TIGR02999 family)
MGSGDRGDITQLLQAYAGGDRGAFDELLPMIYDELRRIARQQLRRTNRGATLDTNGLVHEAYLKLAGQKGIRVEDRGHFLAIAARAMRQIIVSRARARLATKRGGGAYPVTLDEGRIASDDREVSFLLDVDRVLEELRVRDERLARTVECRFFAGLSEEETAEALGVSLRTAQRNWMRARAWIRAELQVPG